MEFREIDEANGIKLVSGIRYKSIMNNTVIQISWNKNSNVIGTYLLQYYSKEKIADENLVDYIKNKIDSGLYVSCLDDVYEIKEAVKEEISILLLPVTKDGNNKYINIFQSEGENYLLIEKPVQKAEVVIKLQKVSQGSIFDNNGTRVTIIADRELADVLQLSVRNKIYSIGRIDNNVTFEVMLNAKPDEIKLFSTDNNIEIRMKKE